MSDLSRKAVAAMLSEAHYDLAEFSPEEQECISKHISQKVREGWDQERAVAAAINICAAGKATSKAQEDEGRGDDKSAFVGKSIFVVKLRRTNKESGVIDSVDVRVYASTDEEAEADALDMVAESPSRHQYHYSVVNVKRTSDFKAKGGAFADHQTEWAVRMRRDDGYEHFEYVMASSEQEAIAKAQSKRPTYTIRGAKRTAPGSSEQGGAFADSRERSWAADFWSDLRGGGAAVVVYGETEEEAKKEALDWMQRNKSAAWRLIRLEPLIKGTKFSASTRLPGGDYTASRNPDGTWNILDVPIFAEVPKGERGNEMRIGAEWMDRAVRKANARHHLRKYLAPTHVHHHDNGVRTERAGYLLPKRVVMVDHPDENRKVPTILADLMFVPEATFRKIEAGELPYRSVEVADWRKPEIASLALLPDEVPFFKFPHLTIGKKVKAGSAIKFSQKYSVAVSCRAVGRGALILFRFQGGSVMPKGKATKSPKLARFEDAEPKDEQLDESRPEEKNPDAAPPWAMEMMGKMDKYFAALAKHSGFSLQEDDEEGKGQMAEDEDAEKASLDDTPDEQGLADEFKPAEQPLAEDEENKETAALAFKAGSPAAKLAEQVAAQGGELAALKALEAKRQASAKLDGLVSKAKVALSEYNLDSDGERLLRMTASAHGEKGVAQFVATWKKNVVKDPPMDMDGLGDEGDSDLPPEVLKFGERGPDALAAAKSAYVDFQQLQGKTQTSLERFLAINVGMAGSNGTVSMKG